MAKTKANKKKQPGRVKRTLAWFKPTTPVKGLVLFVLVFAMLGGGYAIKKSFAATNYATDIKVSVRWNTVYHVQKGHCHMEYMTGTIYGVAYTKTRVRSDYAGRRCNVNKDLWARMNSNSWATLKNQPGPHNWSSTSWSPWDQVSIGPVGYWAGSDVTIQNAETGYYNVYYLHPY